MPNNTLTHCAVLNDIPGTEHNGQVNNCTSSLPPPFVLDVAENQTQSFRSSVSRAPAGPQTSIPTRTSLTTTSQSLIEVSERAELVIKIHEGQLKFTVDLENSSHSTEQIDTAIFVLQQQLRVNGQQAFQIVDSICQHHQQLVDKRLEIHTAVLDWSDMLKGHFGRVKTLLCTGKMGRLGREELREIDAVVGTMHEVLDEFVVLLEGLGMLEGE